MDAEVFEIFFRENYCPVEYGNVKADFEELAGAGIGELFAEDTDFSKITEKNFVVYMDGAAYTEFEQILDDTFDALNPEILDAVMDLSDTTGNPDEITEIYWETKSKLLKEFLKNLYDEKLAKMIEENK
ncbi:MAG: hypothetical protein PUB52_10740 [Lachnospiraceae bacterium]|nr:hypothetical protein [Lachnospiraceae bacterium]